MLFPSVSVRLVGCLSLRLVSKSRQRSATAAEELRGRNRASLQKQGLGLHILELFTATQEEPLCRAVYSSRISYSFLLEK